MPCVTSLDTFHRAVAEFAVTDPGLVIEPPALAAARRSLDSAGLLLLGEMHGVRENPLVIRALMQAFGLTSLALEWPEDLAPMIRAFLDGETLADHWFVWGGDGRITAGHLAVLAEHAAAGPLDLILFDRVIGEGWSWSQCLPGCQYACYQESRRTKIIYGGTYQLTALFADSGLTEGESIVSESYQPLESRLARDDGGARDEKPDRLSRRHAQRA